MQEIPPFSNRFLSLCDWINKKRGEHLAKHSLSPGHDEFLILVLQNAAITMGDLSNRLGISPSSTTKIAVKLEACNLLTRENSRLDSRQYHASLTEEGQALAQELLNHRMHTDAELASRMKGKDGERLLKILDRLDDKPEPVGKKPRKAGQKKRKPIANKEKKSGKKKKKKK